jgi:hypothetical protein
VSWKVIALIVGAWVLITGRHRRILGSLNPGR